MYQKTKSFIAPGFHIGFLIIQIIGAVLLLDCDAFANGGPSEASKMGGIEFKQNDQIGIDEEVLYISQEKIRVSYMFRSYADGPVTVDIAFPSAVGAVDGEAELGTLDFSVVANGDKVEAKKQATFWYEDRDITPLLRQPGVTFGEGFAISLPKSVREILSKESIPYFCHNEATMSNCRVGDTGQEIFTWKQTFKPGLNKIEVSYAPFVGGDYYYSHDSLNEKSGYYFAGKAGRKINMTWQQLFCVDKSVEQALLKFKERHKNTEHPPTLIGGSVYYVLENARYWKGPIKRFHLIVEKSQPSEIVSFCPDYMNPPSGKKTSPTRFEWETTDFSPSGMIRVLFLKQY